MTDPQRRTLMALSCALAAGQIASGCTTTPQPRTVMDKAAFDRNRRYASTPFGRIAYVEQGEGPPIVLLHGVTLNGFHWRHVMAGLGDMRRCIAPDMMGMGHTEITATQDVSLTAQAHMVAHFLDALALDQVDLIGSDSGAGVAQIFAAHYPQRLRTLTLTNGDTHDNWPHKFLDSRIQAAREGKLAASYGALLGNVEAARSRLSIVYADSSIVTDELVRVYFEPIVSTPERQANFNRFWAAFDNVHTVQVEPRLRALKVPTLVVWGTNDMFFDRKWAYWLRDTIPGVIKVVEVPDAKLFFAEDRPRALLDPLRAFLKKPARD